MRCQFEYRDFTSFLVVYPIKFLDYGHRWPRASVVTFFTLHLKIHFRFFASRALSHRAFAAVAACAFVRALTLPIPALPPRAPIEARYCFMFPISVLEKSLFVARRKQ